MIYKTIDRETVAVANSVKQLTSSKVTSEVVYAIVQVQTAQIRYTIDGTAPVAETTGFIGYIGDTFEIWGVDAIINFKAIRETSTSANLEVHYMGAR